MVHPDVPGQEIGEQGEILDRKRLDGLVTSEYRPLMAYLLGAHKIDPDLAEDAISSAYAQTAARLERGETIRVQDPFAFLSRAAANIALKVLNRSDRKNRSLDRILDPKDASQREPISTIQAREKLAKVKKEWDGLFAQERELLTLVDLEGLTLKEAAARLGLVYSTASATYRRAHRKLREELGRHWSTYILPADGDHYAPRGRTALVAEIEGLPREHREVLLAKVVEGFSDEMAAARLKLSAKEFAPRLEHALGLLERKTGLGREEIRRALGR